MNGLGDELRAKKDENVLEVNKDTYPFRGC
jgi:hypothetical protein